MHIVSMHILLKRIKSLIMSITFIGVVVHQHPRLLFCVENCSFAQLEEYNIIKKYARRVMRLFFYQDKN